MTCSCLKRAADDLQDYSRRLAESKCATADIQSIVADSCADEILALPPCDCEERIKELEGQLAYATTRMHDEIEADRAMTRALTIADADGNAQWLSIAHALCSDNGITHGHISQRLEDLATYLVSQFERLAELTAHAEAMAGAKTLLEMFETAEAYEQWKERNK